MSAQRAQSKHGISARAAACYWQAALMRDRRADGTFVLGVRSTHVYCRPSCPARRPLRRNVVFFRNHKEAEQQGFRACLRCRPNEISAAVQLVEALRIKKFKAMLRAGKNIADALYETGYGSSSRIYERSNSQLGMTPATYQKGGKGMKITYTLAKSPLGKVLVAATERGISAVYLGDKENALIAELREEYPRAEIAPATQDHQKWVREIVQRTEGKAPQFELPLDLQATAFQRRVWQELQRIPRGTTRTYSQVARALGKPKAVRAVARACATNPVSIVVPCHRVVREDGNLAGYRWGLSRKERLIAEERSATS